MVTAWWPMALAGDDSAVEVVESLVPAEEMPLDVSDSASVAL